MKIDRSFDTNILMKFVISVRSGASADTVLIWMWMSCDSFNAFSYLLMIRKQLRWEYHNTHYGRRDIIKFCRTQCRE